MLMLLAALLAGSAGLAQDVPASQVPAAVTKAFKAKFPTSTGIDWEKKGNLYEADFDVVLVDHKALFDETGKLVAYKRDIRNADLPAAIKKTIQADYKDYRIDEAQRLERNGVVYYQVELDGKPADQKLVFTKEGKVDAAQQYW